MKKIIITTDTFISGIPAFVGELIATDEGSIRTLIEAKRAELYDAENPTHIALVKARAEATKKKV